MCIISLYVHPYDTHLPSTFVNHESPHTESSSPRPQSKLAVCFAQHRYGYSLDARGRNVLPSCSPIDISDGEKRGEERKERMQRQIYKLLKQLFPSPCSAIRRKERKKRYNVHLTEAYPIQLLPFQRQTMSRALGYFVRWSRYECEFLVYFSVWPSFRSISRMICLPGISGWHMAILTVPFDPSLPLDDCMKPLLCCCGLSVLPPVGPRTP